MNVVWFVLCRVLFVVVGCLSSIGWLLCVASCGSSCWLIMVGCLFVVYLLLDVWCWLLVVR